MASILRVNTLTDASSNNSTAMSTINQGTAKAWCVFAGSSFTTTLDTFNTSGGTDNGTGDYTITITNDMSSVNYATMTSKDDGTSNNWSMPNENNARTKATGSYHVMSTYGGTSTNNTKYDAVRFYSVLHGDLA